MSQHSTQPTDVPASSYHHHHHHHNASDADFASSQSPPNSSGAATPTSASGAPSSFISSSFYNAFGGLMRRLSSDPAGNNMAGDSASAHEGGDGSRSITGGHHASNANFPIASHLHSHLSHSHNSQGHPHNNGIDGVYTPPYPRTASPLRPPPLEPLTLKGFHADTPASARLLTRGIAEEIRIMVPERLRIEDEWKLVYSLDQDGASLATLYEKCAGYSEHRSGFVLVVTDQEGGTFGAYLTEYPHPSPHYFGTGECFLWRASLLPSLPPPPSADTTHLSGRSTSIRADHPTVHGAADSYYAGASTASAAGPGSSDPEPLIPGLSGPPTGGGTRTPAASSAASFASMDQSTSSLASQSSAASSLVSLQPPRAPPSPSIRFSAFPYSGVNEYFEYCEARSLSVGGGDGKYGLWLDDSLEKGISMTCLTFGNQPLSDEGDKFVVLGVEVWVIGSRR